jgi:pilus assembly protein CpaE
MLVESDRLMLEALSLVVQKAEGFSLVARYQTANEALGQGVVFKPNLILLDSDNDNIVSMIAAFTKAYPKASIVCMSEKWQAESASHLMMAGAKGNIIKPFTEQDLNEAVSAFAKSGMETGCEIMAFFSPKGKSGKTTLIANLSQALARRSRAQVGIIDADLQFGDLAVFFNLQAKSTIVEAVRDVKFLSPLTLRPYFADISENVHVLCGTQTPNLIDQVPIPAFEAVVQMSRNLFRYILIDLPSGFNPTSIAAAELADKVFVVSMVNGAYEMEHMRRALEIFQDWPDWRERVFPVFTRVEPCDKTAQEELSHLLGTAVTSIIPNDYEMVATAADNGRMALDIQPDSTMAQRVGKLAQDIMRPKERQIKWGPEVGAQ